MAKHKLQLIFLMFILLVVGMVNASPYPYLFQPYNDSVRFDSNVTFLYFEGNDSLIDNCSIYGNFSGVWGINKTENNTIYDNFSTVQTLTDAGTLLNDVYMYGNRIYAAGDDNRIQIYNRTSFELITQSIFESVDMESVFVDEKYIYGGNANNKLYLYNKTDYSTEYEFFNAGGDVLTIFSDSEYIYAGYTGMGDVYIYNKTDRNFSTVKVLSQATNTIQAIYGDDDYIYVGGDDNKVRVYNRTNSNFGVVATLSDASADVTDVYADDKYIYASSDDDNFVVYNRTSFAKIVEPDEAFDDLTAIYADDKFIYTAGNEGLLRIYNRTSLSVNAIKTIHISGSQINSIYVDSDYVYVASTDSNVYVLSKRLGFINVDLDVGEYIWNIECNDGGVTTFASSNYTLTVKQPLDFFGNDLVNVSYKPTVYMGQSTDYIFNFTTKCYQESPNVSTSCGGLGTGNFSSVANGSITNENRFYNGVWDDLYPTILNDIYLKFYINYSKPANALGAVWVTSAMHGSVATKTNVTIPEACFNQTILQLQFHGVNGLLLADEFGNWSCYNGTDWKSVRKRSGTANAFGANEEAIIWEYGNVTNVDFYYNGTSISFNTTEYEEYNIIYGVEKIIPTYDIWKDLPLYWNYTYEYGDYNITNVTSTYYQLIVDSGHNDTKLNTYLVSPTNGTWSNTVSQTNIFSVYPSNVTLTSCSLYSNYSGTWEVNQTFNYLGPWTINGNIYNYKYDINDTGLDVALAANGTAGFCGEHIWLLETQGNTSIYYNDCTDFIVANSTGVVDYANESALHIGGGNYSSDSRAIFHWGNNTSAGLKEVKIGTTGTNHGADYVNESNCLFGGCYNFTESNSDYLDYDNVATGAPYGWHTQSTGSIAVWVKVGDTHATRMIWSANDGGPDKTHLYYSNVANRWKFLMDNAGSYDIDIVSNSAPIEDTWQHIVITQDGSTSRMYIDGQVQSDTDSGEWFSHIAPFTEMDIGRQANTNDNYFNGTIDEFRIYAKALNQTEITALYNNGISDPLLDFDTISPNSSSVSFDTVNLISGEYIWNVNCTDNVSNTDSATNNNTLIIDVDDPIFGSNSTNSSSLFPEIGQNIALNLTVTDNYLIDTCILQINDNGSWWNNGTFIVNTNYTYILNMNFTIRNESKANNTNVSWRVWCNDSAGNYNYSLNYTIEIKDDTDPVFILNPNNFFATESVITNYLYPTQDVNITFSDYNLFQAEMNITCNVSGSVYNWSILDINTSYNYIHNDTVNLTGLPPQGCQVHISVSDDHTAKKIPKYKVTESTDSLLFDTEHDISVKVKSDDLDVKNTNTNKLKDRYSFEFDYDDKEYARNFTIESSNKLYYQPESKYPAHFVVWNEAKGAGNWIDFSELGKRNIDYEVIKINDYKYEVKVSAIPPDKELPTKKKGWLAWMGIGTDMTQEELKLEKYGIKNIQFNSIGGTNVVNATYPFYIGAAINLSGLNIYDNTSIENWTVNVTTINSYPGWNGTVTINGTWDWFENITNGTYQLDFSHPEFFNRTYILTVNNISQNWSYASMNSQVNFRFRNPATGAYLDNFTVNLNDTVTGYEQNISFENLTTGTFYLNDSNYSYLVQSFGYDNLSGNVTTTYFDNLTIINNVAFLTTFHFIDERTLDPFNMTSPDTINFLLFCNNGTYTTVIPGPDPNATLPISCNYTKFKFVLEYGITSYYRTYIFTPAEAIESNIYLINKNTTQDIYNSFVLDDLLDDYDNPRIFIKKSIGNSTSQITADWVDVESKIGAYLIENHEYIIEVQSDNRPTRIMGLYSADLSGVKVLRLYDINLGSDSGSFNTNVSYGVWVENVSGDDYGIVGYTDTANQTLNITWRLYRDSWNGTLIYMVSTTNNSVEFMYNLSDWTNNTIYSALEVQHASGNFSQNKILYEFNEILLDILTYVGQGFMNWFLIILLSVLAIMGTIKTGNMVSLGMVGLAALFVTFGWLRIGDSNVVGIGILALAALIALISILKEGDKNSL